MSSQNQGTGATFYTSSWRERVSSKLFYGKRGTISNFLDVPSFFTVDSVVFGPWYDHVNGWWEKKQTYSKLHYMFYEDLIEVS